MSVNQILCPVDFSDSSLNAARWALYLAQKASCPILFLHSYGAFSQDNETAISLYPEFRRISEDSMHRFLERLNPQVGMRVQSNCTPLDLTQDIRQRCEEIPNSMVVMSTHGAHGWSRFILGSNAVSVLHAVDVPVLVLPHDFTLEFAANPISEWLLAISPAETRYFEALQWIKQFIDSLGGRLTPGFVDIGTEGSGDAEYFLQWCSDHLPNCPPQLVVAEKPSFGIEELVKRSDANAVVLISREVGWLRDSLRRHTSDELVFMGKYPVMVVPERSSIFVEANPV